MNKDNHERRKEAAVLKTEDFSKKRPPESSEAGHTGMKVINCFKSQRKIPPLS